MKFYPYGDIVAIKPDGYETRTEQGVYHEAKRHPCYISGAVLSIGHGIPNGKGVYNPTEFEIGDRILIDVRTMKSGFGGWDSMHLVSRESVVAVLEKDAKIN